MDTTTVPQPTQMIFATTSAWLLSERDWHTHATRRFVEDRTIADRWRQLLCGLLDPSLPGTAGYRRPQGPDQTDWLLTNEACQGIAQEIEAAWHGVRRRNVQGERDAGMNALEDLHHVVYLDATRSQQLFARNYVAGCHVVLDFRFVRVFAKVRCHVRILIWDHPPLDPYFRPETADRSMSAAQPLRTGKEIKDRRNQLTALREEILDKFREAKLSRENIWEDKKRIRLPEFWVVVPSTPEPDPMVYFERHISISNTLARALLDAGDARETTVATGVLGGGIAAMRRVRIDERPHHLLRKRDREFEERPAYVLILAQGVEALRLGNEPSWWKIMRALSDLEAEATHLLVDIRAQIDIIRNHFRVYRSVIERGSFLWDALSTHFAIRRRRDLAEVHKWVGLLHQIMLQAVADLDHMAGLLRSKSDDIAQLADRLYDRHYGPTVTERAIPEPGLPPGRSGLRFELFDTGRFGAAKQQSREGLAEAERVKVTYHDLMRAIESAFDERRVRESDRLQDISALLAAGLGITGLVTVFDATVDLKPEWYDALDSDQSMISVFGWFTAPHWIDDLFVLISLGLGAVGLIMALVFGLGLVGMGRLGSRHFRRIYGGSRADPDHSVWGFLLHTSTDNLDRLKASVASTTEAFTAAEWHELDLHLASQFAYFWDEACRRTPIRRKPSPRNDIEDIGAQIEEWGVLSLLRTERARRMYAYRLPNLTCLYRSVERVETPRLSYVVEANMVDEVDLNRSLERLGFDRIERECIDEWLRIPSYGAAGEAWERIQLLGLHGGMADHADDAMIAGQVRRADEEIRAKRRADVQATARLLKTEDGWKRLPVKGREDEAEQANLNPADDGERGLGTWVRRVLGGRGTPAPAKPLVTEADRIAARQRTMRVVFTEVTPPEGLPWLEEQHETGLAHHGVS